MCTGDHNTCCPIILFRNENACLSIRKHPPPKKSTRYSIRSTPMQSITTGTPPCFMQRAPKAMEIRWRPLAGVLKVSDRGQRQHLDREATDQRWMKTVTACIWWITGAENVTSVPWMAFPSVDQGVFRPIRSLPLIRKVGQSDNCGHCLCF